MEKILNLKKNKIIFFLVVKGLFFSLIIVFFFYMVLNSVAPGKVMNVFNHQHFVIRSSSMHPVLEIGDLVVVKKTKASKIEEGMIISFYQDIRFDPDGEKDVITHYVHQVIHDGQEYKFKTRRHGENVTPDSWTVLEDELIGVYQFSISQVGKIVLFFNHPLGFRIILIDVVIVYLIVLILTPDDDNEEKKSKKENKICNL